MINPWFAEDWSRIAKTPDGLHHGVLLTGHAGIGKAGFAETLSEFLLCSNASGANACGECQSCRLFRSATHPDFHVLTTEEFSVENELPLLSRYSDRYQDSVERDKKTRHSKVISIDQVRTLIDRFTQFSHISAYKVALITPAERLNVNAANALLKLLEEPPDNAILILVTSEPGRLPATIRSRCISYPLSTPDHDVAINWLESVTDSSECEKALSLASGGPISARKIIQEGHLEIHHKYHSLMTELAEGGKTPVDVASQLAKLNFEVVLSWLMQYVSDLILFRMAGRKPDWACVNKGFREEISVQRLYGVYDRISEYKRISREPVNEQLALEELILSLSRATR